MCAQKMSRRDFLKTAGAAAGLLLLPKDVEANIARTHLAGAAALDTFPDAEYIGRNCSGGILYFRARPSADANSVKIVYEDALFPIYREVIGEPPAGSPIATWYETPYGYAFSPNVQLVKNEPNALESDLPQTSMGKGFWAEITVPYVSLIFDSDPISPWYQSIYGHNPRAYYGRFSGSMTSAPHMMERCSIGRMNFTAVIMIWFTRTDGLSAGFVMRMFHRFIRMLKKNGFSAI